MIWLLPLFLIKLIWNIVYRTVYLVVAICMFVGWIIAWLLMPPSTIDPVKKEKYLNKIEYFLERCIIVVIVLFIFDILETVFEDEGDFG